MTDKGLSIGQKMVREMIVNQMDRVTDSDVAPIIEGMSATKNHLCAVQLHDSFWFVQAEFRKAILGHRELFKAGRGDDIQQDVDPRDIGFDLVWLSHLPMLTSAFQDEGRSGVVFDADVADRIR